MADFHLIRRSDGLIYRFAAHPDQSRTYLRADRADLAITWEDALGWVMRDPTTGALTGRVWDIEVTDQPARPPAAVWVTAKGDKSYVYDLRYDAAEAAP